MTKPLTSKHPIARQNHPTATRTLTPVHQPAPTSSKTIPVRQSASNYALNKLAKVLDGQLLVSQNRVVNALLDLYNVSPGPATRSLIAEVLTVTRHQSAVPSQLINEYVIQIAAAVAVEQADATNSI